MGRRLVFLAALLLLRAGAADAGLPAAGARAPAFSLRELNDEGQAVASTDLFRDRVTLVSFFATWCESCKKEIPLLRRLDAQYRDRGFHAVLICVDIMGARNVRPYLEEAGGAGLRVLLDRAGTTAGQYGVAHLPTTLLVGPDEGVVLSWEDHRKEKLDQVETYLARLPVRPPPAPAPAPQP